MTDEQLKTLREKELIALRLIDDCNDIFIAGCCSFSSESIPFFYTSHPLAPMSKRLIIEDQPGSFVFHPTGKLLNEALQDEEFSNYYRFAERNLDLPDDDQESRKFVAVTVALTFEQASIEADLRPEWFVPYQLPLDKINDVYSLMNRMDECLRAFCAQYSDYIPDKRRLH